MACLYLSMHFIDTHSHLYSSQFSEDINPVLENCKNLGVKQIILPNIDVDSWADLESLVSKNPTQLYPTVGLHPCSVKENYKAELAKLEKLLDKPNNVAIGEIGIDLYWDKTFLSAQQEAFKIQCQWAKDLGLPIIIHVRDAWSEIFDLMDELIDEKLSGVFHCFTGGEIEIEKIKSYKTFYFGIGGVITFKKGGVDKVAHLIPKDKLLLETDSPYLAPTPHRGKRNSSEYIPLIAEKLAQCIGLTIEQVAELTTKNAQNLFKI